MEIRVDYLEKDSAGDVGWVSQWQGPLEEFTAANQDDPLPAEDMQAINALRVGEAHEMNLGAHGCIRAVRYL